MNRSSLSRSLGVVALLGLAACGVTKRTPEGAGGSLDPATPTVDAAFAAKEPTVMDREMDPERSACDTDATLALPLGLTRWTTVEEATAALRGTALFPDPATLPEGSVFHEAYYNAGMQGQFKQSTIGVIYFGPAVAGETKLNEIAVMMYNSAFKELPPRTPAQELRIRGLKAYGFNVPFEEGIHSVMWREGCRYHSVISKLPAKEIVRIAEGLKVAPERADAAAGDPATPTATTER